MISKKITDLKQFSLILTIGALINQAGHLLFRTIALIILQNIAYGLFSITISTFDLFLPFASFMLHSPLTRDIRKAESKYELKKVYQNFVVCYCLTSTINFLLFFIMGIIFLNYFHFFLILFLSLSLIFQSFAEFFIGLSRGYSIPVRAVILSVITGILRGLFAFISLFVLVFQNANFFLFFFSFGYLIQFFLGLIFYRSEIKKYLFKFDLIEINRIKSSIKNSSFLLSNTFLDRLVKWILTFIALVNLRSLSFKVFDLCILFISFIRILGGNLTIAMNSNRNLKKVHKNFRENQIIKKIIPIILINIFLIFFLFFTNIDYIILKLILGEIPLISLLFVRTILFVPIPYIFASYFYGWAQNFGHYSVCIFARVVGFLGSIIIYIILIIFNSFYLLFIGLIIEKLLFSLVLINFESKNKSLKS